MDKRTVLAFLFIAVILMFTPYYYKMVGLAERDDEKEPPPSTVRKEATEDLSPVAGGEQASAEPRQRAASRFALGAPQEDAVSFRVDSDLYSATVSSRGGGTFTSFKLKHYKTHGGDLVDLVYPPINGSNVVVQFKDLSGETFTLDYPFSPPDAFYPGQTLPVGPGGLTLTFHTEIDGRTVSKAVTFHADSYIIDIRVDLSQISEQLISQEKFTLTWRGGLPATEENAPADIREFAGFLYQGGEQIRTKHKKSDVHAVAGTGRTAWAAIRSKYFTAALIPRDDSNFGQVVAGPYNPPREADAPPPDYSMAVGFSSKQPVLCSLYLGPLKYSRIKSLNVGLENTMSFGISVIRPISKGVLLLLTSMHKIVPNYGVLLIIFSILVKVIVYPLTRKSYQSTKEMQAIQPLIAELREKFKGDPQRLNKATMSLYKEHHVNPLGGCLPMLLQMPLLFALFIVFRTTIELRGAPFVWWIRDLSAPDAILSLPFTLPLYGDQVSLLPIFMGISMFIQQKMMGTQTSGQQKYMSYFMTGFFLLIFNQFPSGLNLYYTLFNVLTILQQKYLVHPTPPKLQPARAKKK